VDFSVCIQRVIQINTLEDRSVHDKQQWDAAVKFMETSVGEKLNQSESSLTFSLCMHCAAFEQCWQHCVIVATFRYNLQRVGWSVKLYSLICCPYLVWTHCGFKK